MPVHIVLSQGQSSDKTVAPPLIEAVEPGAIWSPTAVTMPEPSSIWSKAVAGALTSQPAATARFSVRSILLSIDSAI